MASRISPGFTSLLSSPPTIEKAQLSEENIVEKAEKTELRSILYKKIDELGEPESTIIMQKYFFGRTSKEIADIVSMSADNVRAHCSRAVKKLKDMLVQVGYTR